jgi:hypothetical protein
MKAAYLLRCRSPEELEKFHQYAWEEDCSLAELIRRGIKLYVKTRRIQKSDEVGNVVSEKYKKPGKVEGYQCACCDGYFAGPATDVKKAKSVGTIVCRDCLEREDLEDQLLLKELQRKIDGSRSS